MTIQRTILIINLAIIALGAYFGVSLFYKNYRKPAQVREGDG
jgi:hypothetical protein